MHRIEGADYSDDTGVNLFTQGPPGTVVTAEWLNSFQEELALLLTTAGQSLKTQTTDTRNQLIGSLALGKYYYPDYTEYDQGASATGDGVTIKDCVDDIGTDVATIVLLNPSAAVTYRVRTSITIPDNVTIIPHPGAVLTFASGATGSHAGPIIAGQRLWISMVDRDSFTYTGPSMLIDKWFGSQNDNSFNDSNAINDMIGAAGEHSKVWITKGTLKVNSVDFDQSDMDIVCDGQFAPYADSGYCVRLGSDAGVVSRLTGNMAVDSNGTYETWSTVIGLEIVNLKATNMSLRAEGCAVGLDVYGDSQGVSYNQFRLEQIKNSKINCRLDARGAGGWCNQNLFIGGQFAWNSGLTYTGTKHIQIVYDATNILNNNIFYGPSFEGGDANSIAIDCDGQFNYFLDCRLEMGGYNYQTIHMGSNSNRNKFSTAFSDNLIGGSAVSLPGSIVSSDSTSITMDTDPGDRVWSGSMLELTIGGVGYNVIVYSSGTTIEYAHPCEADSGNLVTAVKALPIHNEGRTNIFELSRVDDSGTSNLGILSRHEQLFYNDGGAAFRGTGSYIPAVALITGSSAANAVLTVRDFTGLTAQITGAGYFNGFNSNEQSTIDIETDYNDAGRILVKNTGTTKITLDSWRSCITLVAVASGTPSNNSIYLNSADGKLTFKDSTGTSHALY